MTDGNGAVPACAGSSISGRAVSTSGRAWRRKVMCSGACRCRWMGPQGNHRPFRRVSRKRPGLAWTCGDAASRARLGSPLEMVPRASGMGCGKFSGRPMNGAAGSMKRAMCRTRCPDQRNPEPSGIRMTSGRQGRARTRRPRLTSSSKPTASDTTELSGSRPETATFSRPSMTSRQGAGNTSGRPAQSKAPLLPSGIARPEPKDASVEGRAWPWRSDR